MIDGAVLLVHDVVHDFLDGDPALEAPLQNIALLIAAAHRVGLPVMFAAPDRDTPGAEVPTTLGILSSDTVLRKPRYGAFFGTTLADDLRAAGRDTIVLCGISLTGGVETTVRDAFNHRLNSVVVADAVLCRPVPDQGWGDVTREEVARVTLSVLGQRFARITTTAEVCAQLTTQ
jgi:nicotinamidase-related amidase